MDIVFRDLKPGNVLIGEDGHVQLTDFGVAKENASKSAEQTTCGTPLYMSPEQVHHATMQEGGYSFTVDWWALGTLIFEALAGRPPFKARQIGNIMQKIANEEHKFPDGLELSAYGEAAESGDAAPADADPLELGLLERFCQKLAAVAWHW